ncbi:MAG: hypothetical protein H0V88_05775 [Pyrinomonadaceae bacterium]|nr:hypothetical protein [Pyrinomonadaceae bacterium]
MRAILFKTLTALTVSIASACVTQTSNPEGRMIQENAARRESSSASPLPSTSAQSEGAQANLLPAVSSFRGSLGSRGIEMRLQRDGEKVSGTYAYDGINENLTLTGRIDAQGILTLAEFDARGKQTGKFDCHVEVEPDEESAVSINGNWARPDGSRQAPVALSEQHDGFTNGLRIVSKVIRNSKYDVAASYPQLVGSNATVAAGVEKFNQRIAVLVSENVRRFVADDPPPGKSSYETSFNVLLATDDLISVEIVEDSYSGGAYPNSYYYALTYDLRRNREVQLEELFKPGSKYKEEILRYCLDSMNKSAQRSKEEEARREGKPRPTSDEPLFSAEEVSEWQTWAMTRRGLIVYFDFAHVIAAYNREFVPYRVVADYLKPDSPAARLGR